MTIETLKLMQSKQNNGLIIPMYSINIPMDLSIQIMRFIIIYKKYYITLVCKNNNCKAQKTKLIPKIQCTFGTIILYVL